MAYTVMDDEMTRYSGPLSDRPWVQCETSDGDVIEGVVIMAVWLDGAEFDAEAQFVVLTDDNERFTMNGWSVMTTVLG